MAALLAKIDRLSVAYKAAVAAAAAEAAERTEAARQEEEARRKRLAAAQVAGIAIAEEPEDGSEDAGAGAGASAGVNVGRPVAKRSTLGGFTKSLRSAGSRMAASLGSILTTGHWTAKPRFVPVPVALPRARQALAAIATAASLRDQREADEDDEASPPHPMYNRTAIVVGNESYPAAVGGELEAAGENAQAVAAALVAAAPVGDSAARRHGGGAGWSSGSVTFVKDAQGAELAQRVRAAAAKLVDNDVLLLYYSGYGTETAGKLYFLMCDTHYFPPSNCDHGVRLCVCLCVWLGPRWRSLPAWSATGARRCHHGDNGGDGNCGICLCVWREWRRATVAGTDHEHEGHNACRAASVGRDARRGVVGGHGG